MKKIALYFSLCFSLILFSCVGNEIHYEKKLDNNIKINTINNENDKRDDICNKLLEVIAGRYYNYPNHRNIRVHLKQISSNFKDEPALSKYLYNYVRQYFKQASQCTIVPLNDPTLDCIVQLHVINSISENDQNPIEILSNILEPINNNIIFSKKYHFNFNDFNYPKYLEYKSSYVEKEQETQETSFLRVKAINIGSSYKEKDKYYINRVYGSFGISDTIWKKDTGYTGYYPAKQKCIINGKQFNMGNDKVFYSDKILPGSIDIIASFRLGMWDAYNRQQKLYDKYQKKFYVILKENDNINVDILFIYRGNKPDIKVKAYKKKQIKRGRNIETINEIIEVFSK